MEKLIEWLEDSIEQMEVVKGMLPSDNAGHLEALGRQKAYKEAIDKIKEQEDQNA